MAASERPANLDASPTRAVSGTRARPRPITRAVFFVSVAIAALAVSSAIDGPIAAWTRLHPFGYSYDLYTMLRLGGYVPVWAIVSSAFVLIDSQNGWRRAWSRGGLLFAAVIAAGVVAEVLKIVVRRERPALDVMDYVFRPWNEDTYSSAGLGWPSSHTAVAFAAVWTLWRLYPRATAVWLFIGLGCALSRLARNDHFASDVVGGILVGYAVVAALWLPFRKTAS